MLEEETSACSDSTRVAELLRRHLEGEERDAAAGRPIVLLGLIASARDVKRDVGGERCLSHAGAAGR